MTHRVSPSQIKTWRDCKRKWAFEKIEGISAPPTDKQAFGTEVHARLEAWFRSRTPPDRTPAGEVARQGIRLDFAPAPADDLLIEKSVTYDISLPGEDLLLAGFADLIVPPRNEDPPIVVDWKSTSNFKWAMTPEELREDPQALIYGAWAHETFGRDPILRWNYLAATNPPNGLRRPAGAKKTEIKLIWDDPDTQKAWDRIVDDAREISQARDTWQAANDAPPSPDACGKFGGCPFRDRCGLASDDVFVARLEQFERERLTTKRHSVTKEAEPKPLEGGTMSTLFEKLQKMKATAEAGGNPLKPQAVNPPAAETPKATAPETPKETVNVPAPSTATETPEAPAKEQCPACGKSYKHLQKHIDGGRCKGAMPEPDWQAAKAKASATPNAQAAKDPAVKEIAAKMSAPPAPKSPGLMVLFDCALRKSPNNGSERTINLADWIAPIAKAVAADNGVEHFGLVDFAKGAPMLAAKTEAFIEAQDPSGVIFVDSYSLEGRAVKDVLIRNAAIVVQGVR